MELSWSSLFADLETIRKLAALLRQCLLQHKSYILLLFVAVYLYNQTFAVPGTFTLVRSRNERENEEMM